MANQNGERGSCIVFLPPDTSGQSNRIFGDILSPALAEAGLDAVLQSTEFQDPAVLRAAAEAVQTASLALFDITGSDPFVFWALGARSANSLASLVVCGDDQPALFSAVPYRPARIYDEVLQDREAICTAAKKLLEDARAPGKIDPNTPENPLAVDIKTLRQTLGLQPDEAQTCEQYLAAFTASLNAFHQDHLDELARFKMRETLNNLSKALAKLSRTDFERLEKTARLRDRYENCLAIYNGISEQV